MAVTFTKVNGESKDDSGELTKTAGSTNFPTVSTRSPGFILINTLREQSERISWIENRLNTWKQARNRSC